MNTFDLAEVRAFTADLDSRMNQCDNGEGTECANLDGMMRHYAVLCCEFCQRVRQWGRAIFYGQVAFDPAVEILWLEEGDALFDRASQLWDHGKEMQGECFVLDNGAALGSALWRLERLLTGWVTPQRAIAPLARLGVQLPPDANDEIQKRVAALAPLPADWQPSDPRRRALLRKPRRRRNP